MEKKVAIIHTSFVSVDTLKQLFAEIMPEVKLINIVDDSLLQEVMAAGEVTPGVVRRICNYAQQAESLGATAILNQCSSVGEAADVAQRLIKIPYLKIDQPMAEKAVELGRRIAVVATVASTMGPSVRLIKKAAEHAGKEVQIRECLVDGALNVLMKEGKREKHNQMVLGAIERIKDECDVIVLAQGSMVVLLPELKHLTQPVLTSPRMGVEKVQNVLSSVVNRG